MDASRRIGIRNERGSTLVYFALAVVVLLAMAALAVDMGFMYSSRAQLKVAADAGALAGADRMLEIGAPAPSTTQQADIKSVAQNIAQQNKAANTNVVLKNNGSNSIGANNDLALGHWDGTRFKAYSTPMNAIKVKTRRTADNAGVGPVPAIFAKIVGKHDFDISAESVAAIEVKASNFIAICNPTLSCSTNLACQEEPGCPVNLLLQPSPPDPLNPNPQPIFAWTTYYDNSTSAAAIKALIDGPPPSINACGTRIYTTMGMDVDAFRDLESAMYSRDYQPDAKHPETGPVTSWDIIVPVTEECTPTAQGASNDPHLVTWYARVRVESICINGAAGYYGVKPTNSECPPGPAGAAYEKVIYVTNVRCISCSSPDLNQFLGVKQGLVK